MTDKDEFNTMYDVIDWSFMDNEEWSRDSAIDCSFMEAEALAKAEAEGRKLKELRELIEKSHQERSNEDNQ